MNKRRSLMRKISEQSDHAIVCGAGKTGIFVIEEFEKINEPYVAIDTDPEAIGEFALAFPMP
ncbi:MAG: NAD-binding protein [Planctomycetota bacterium]|nr:NAD-binding protein [Planctomycetota bacterium]